MRNWNHAFVWKMADRFRVLSESDLDKQYLIELGLWCRQILDLHATEKSRYFAQPLPIVVSYYKF